MIRLAKEKKVKPVKEKKAKKQKEPMKPERTETGGLDYSVYYMSVPEKLGYTALAAAALFALGWIFYRSVPMAALMMVFAVKYPAIRTKEIIAKRREKLTLQFKDMLYSLSSALSAGNSVERSMTLVLEDMERRGVPFEERELAVSGKDIMEALNISAGPKVGSVKRGLLLHCARVPEDNKREILLKIARDLVNNS